MFKINGLSYKNIINNISLNIEDGEFISLLGSNGSGKTTLALIMSGLISEIDDNFLEFDKKPALIFENPDNQIIGTTVEEDIAFGLQNKQLSREEITNKIDEILFKLNIQDLKNREIHTLSGGQKQKVAFASLMVLDYDFYILDEVTSMLDPKSKKIILDLINELNTQGKTIIQITHFLEEIKNSSRTIIMKSGSIIFDGNTKKILKNKKMLEENRLI